MGKDVLNIQHFDVIDSTNTEACRQIDTVFSSGNTNFNINTKPNGDANLNVSANLSGQTGAGSLKSLHKKVIVADSQTAGKGRLNRSFYSPKSTGIYMSLIWVLDADDNLNIVTAKADGDISLNVGAGDFNPALYTATAAVGVIRAIKSVYNIDTKIKWVNDLYLGDKKICGILAEGKINPKTGKIAVLVVGIGVNISMPKGDFPDDVKNKAGALFSGDCPIGDITSSGEQVCYEENKDAMFRKPNSPDDAMFIDELISQIAENVFKIYEDKTSFPIVLNEYREKSNLIGKIVTVSPVINQSETYKAEVLDITENAELKVKLQNGEIRELSSGEVSLHQDQHKN